MKLCIYAIKDTAVGRFSPTPIILENDEVARRTFGTVVNTDPNRSEVSRYYKDMQIYKLAEFDDKTGEIVNDIHLVANGVDVKEFGSVDAKLEEVPQDEI